MVKNADLSVGATERFTGRAHLYAAHRPGYPDRLIAEITRDLPRDAIVLDAGAGTGIGAELLAPHVARVEAVEPNDDMRRHMRRISNVVVHPTRAEATGLKSASVDGVFCFQSFHWFRAAEALREFHRVLRPNAILALVWYLRDEGDPFMRELSALVREASGGSPATDLRGAEAPLRASESFRLDRRIVDSLARPVDRAGLFGWALSASYLPKTNGGLEPALAAALDDLFARSSGPEGLVVIRYTYRAFLAHRV